MFWKVIGVSVLKENIRLSLYINNSVLVWKYVSRFYCKYPVRVRSHRDYTKEMRAILHNTSVLLLNCWILACALSYPEIIVNTRSLISTTFVAVACVSKFKPRYVQYIWKIIIHYCGVCRKLLITWYSDSTW